MNDLATMIEEESHGRDVHFSDRYSGRGMMGRNCVSVSGSNSECMVLVGSVIKAAGHRMVQNILADMSNGEPAVHEFEQIVDTVLDYRTDNLGRDIVIYWPDVTVN